ncbi:hypothetical protein EVG20_g11180 [Dentipellis fragilis]|uniref:Uncharacterized protein n=1 Tax=Dentipellis fragilis TaxID=205917 RepID=A0A4Y9XRA9_9AGAM|nr:hypothetical protein EVG20_g11180 [Dentipellis fragilis]
MDSYFQALSDACKQLSALDVTITDTEFKDVLLMNMDSSAYPLHTIILAQKTEPDLDAVLAILHSSSATSPNPLVKQEEDPASFASATSIGFWGRGNSSDAQSMGRSSHGS